MNWEAIGAIGEIVGAVAVIATILYLSIQVRQNKASLDANTKSAQVSMLDQHTQSQSRWRGRIADSSEIARIWLAARDEGREDLNEQDRLRFDQIAIDFFNTWRSSYASAMNIGHDGQLKHIAESSVQLLSAHKGLYEMWTKGGRRYSSYVVPEYAERVEKLLKERDAEGDV